VRNAEQFAWRYGVGGEASATLQAIGDKFSLTRERVRQVIEKLVGELVQKTVWAPAAQRCRAEVVKLLPMTEQKLNSVLRAELGDSLELRGLWRFCSEVLGERLSISLTEFHSAINGDTIAVAPNATLWVGYAHSAAVKLIGHCGAAQLHLVAATVHEQHGLSIRAADVAEVMQARQGFEWLDQEKGWFWFGADENRNRILKYVRKILAVAVRRVDVDEIFEGICRYSRSIPRQVSVDVQISPGVLQAMLSRTSWIRTVQSNDFCLADPVVIEDVLSSSELIIYNLLKRRNGVASRNFLRRRTVDKGRIEFVTFGVTLDGSPMIKQVDRGVFMLRGWPVAARSLTRAQREVGLPQGARLRPLRVPATLPDGIAEFEVIMTPGCYRNRQHSMPARLRGSIPDGKYIVSGERDLALSAKGAVLRGVATYGVRQHLPIGTRIAVRIHVGSQLALVAPLLDAPTTDGREHPRASV
jgi:hypothetical protein